MMQRYQITLKPHSPFSTPLVGDTLFGQLCWSLRFRYGGSRLNDCLRAYTEGQPFLVVSDAMPHGYIPMPCLPFDWMSRSQVDTKARKALKKRRWLPATAIEKNPQQWLDEPAPTSVVSPLSDEWLQTEMQPRNSIHRWLNTTSGAEFAPYTETRDWFTEQALLTLYVVIDESRLSANECLTLLEDIGLAGFGKNASIGNGQFRVLDMTPLAQWGHTNANAYLTLAHCTPQGGDWQTSASFYQTLVRFGRHGAQAVHLGNPFKAPVLFAATGAVLTPVRFSQQLYVGKGLGGSGQVSNVLPSTVTQGYAPVAPLFIERVSQQVA